MKGGKGIIPFEAAKILAHYGSIDKVNTEDADDELAMKSFQESEDRKTDVLKKEDEETEIGTKEEGNEKDGASKSDETKNESDSSNFDKTKDSEKNLKDPQDDTAKKEEESTKDVEKEERVDNEERSAEVKNEEEDTVDHIAKIKSIHSKSPSLRQMLGLDDDQKLNELSSLQTKVKKFTTSFNIIEDSKHKIPDEGEFSFDIKFNAILTLVILKHETTLQVNESGKISGKSIVEKTIVLCNVHLNPSMNKYYRQIGFIKKDKSFKNLSLSLQVDSLFKSFVEIIKSSVKNALASDSKSGTIPNQRFQVEVAPIDKIVSPPKPVITFDNDVFNGSTQDSQESRKRRRSEFNVNDMSESFRSKRGSMASLLSMASVPNYGQDSRRTSMINFNDIRRGSTINFNDSRRSSMANNNDNRRASAVMFGQENDNRRASVGMFGQHNDNRRASVAAMLGQNMLGNNNQGMNQLMNQGISQGMNPFMNMSQSNHMNNNNNNQFNMSGMNSMNSMNDSNNMYPRSTSFADAIDAVRFAERRQSQTRQSRALALAAAETAKMNEIKAAMRTLKRSSVGMSTGVNSMAAAAEAVRLADMENNLDSLGSKIADSRDNSGNTPSTSDLIRLLDNSRSSMVGGQDSSQVNMDQSQRMDLEAAVQTLRRHSNLGSNAGGTELSGILDSLGRDEGNVSSNRRRSSYGGSALMENVLKALRRQSTSMPRPSEAGGSMAAAAEAVRLAEMDVMSSLKRRRSSGNSMTAAADIVRQADLDAAMNTLRGRRSSAGNNSIAAAAEAVRLAEMENSTRRRSYARRHSSYGGTSAMAAAAEIVRMSEENNNTSSNSNRNYSSRRSFMMSDEMMRETDDLNNVMNSTSAANTSLSGAAGNARLTDTDGNLSSLINSNNNFLSNQNNMDSQHRSRRVSFRLNNSSRDYGMNNGYQV